MIAQIHRNAWQTVVYPGSPTPQIDQLFGTIQAKNFKTNIGSMILNKRILIILELGIMLLG